MASLTSIPVPINGWERAMNAAEKVKERLRRATKALAEAKIDYAIVGGNAVAEWVGRVDEGAVRNTKDVDILIRRSDFEAVKHALEKVGFFYHEVWNVHSFIDGPDGKPSQGLHLIFANEKFYDHDIINAPAVEESESGQEFSVISLDALVRMKLFANRRKDQVHLLDLISVGLVDNTWPARLPPVLGERLQKLLDDPNG